MKLKTLAAAALLAGMTVLPLSSANAFWGWGPWDWFDGPGWGGPWGGYPYYGGYPGWGGYPYYGGYPGWGGYPYYGGYPGWGGYPYGWW